MSNLLTQPAIQNLLSSIDNRQSTIDNGSEASPFPFPLSPFPSKRGHGCQLDRKQEQAILALLTHSSIAQAASACDLSESTLRRWLKYPPFQLAYSQARQQGLDTALGQLQHASGKFVTALLDLIYDPSASASVRLGAIRTGLQWCFQPQQQQFLSSQIVHLEFETAKLPPQPPLEEEPTDLLPLPQPTLAPQKLPAESQSEQAPVPQSTLAPTSEAPCPIQNPKSKIQNGTVPSSAVICTSDAFICGIPEPDVPIHPEQTSAPQAEGSHSLNSAHLQAKLPPLPWRGEVSSPAFGRGAACCARLV